MTKKLVNYIQSCDCVKVMNIRRDIRDAVVSAYYHFKRVRKTDISFLKYYWIVGRYKGIEVIQYNLNWDSDRPNVFETEFESLKTDLEGEYHRIGAFLGIETTRETFLRIKEETTLDKLQKERGEDKLPEEQRFFRKGVIGDWKNHFDEEGLEDIARIERNNLTYMDKVRFSLMFASRRKIQDVMR